MAMNKLRLLLGSCIAFFFGFVAWLVTMANQGESTIFFQYSQRFAYGDKLGHGLLFFSAYFAFLTALNLRPSAQHYLSFARLRGVTAFVISLILAVLEEWSQRYNANREFDWVDLLASVAGLSSAFILSLLVIQCYYFHERACKHA